MSDKSKTGFSLIDSIRVKGFACILLIVHHLFNANYIYKTVLVTEKWNYMDNVVSLAKVCVILFLIISGYGLSEQYHKKENYSFFSAVKFVLRHIIKLYLSYWFIYIIFVPMGYLFGRGVDVVYEGRALYFLLDFLGISYLIGTPMANRTWWYISVLLIYYLLFPVAEYIMRKFKYVSLILFGVVAFYAWFFVGTRLWYIYFVPFLFGMLLSRFQIFDKIDYILNDVSSKWRMGIYILGILLFVGARILWLDRRMFYYVFDWFFALIIILLIREIHFLTVIEKIIELLGKHSGNIFMFHTFLFSIYLRDWVYAPEYAVAILIIFITVCVLISFAIEWIKDKIHYGELLKIINI